MNWREGFRRAVLDLGGACVGGFLWVALIWAFGLWGFAFGVLGLFGGLVVVYANEYGAKKGRP